MQFRVVSLTDNLPVAQALLEAAGARRVLAFVGDLGAGKTTFIKALCQLLGVAGEVTSPTFALVNEYAAANDATVYHFDFYRLKHEMEAYDIGADEYFDSGQYCFVEWPERVPTLLPSDTLRVVLTLQPDGVRTIEW
jgi:tRNA threonylcarbamoyladenosine biosynthesis protein TsaE